jgi:hypothetical protein
MSKLFKFLDYGNKGPTVKPENPGKTLWNLVKKDTNEDEDEDDVVKKVENFFKTYSNTYISVVNWANPDDNDSTPLYLTATEESYNPVVTQMLISKRADVNKANSNGETPLYRATADGLSDVVWRLIFEHADVNKANNNGETPLYRAAADGLSDVVRLLINEHADVNKANNNGETPLYRAAADGLSDVVRLLINEHADVNKKTLKRKTPLDIARKKRDYYEPLDKHKHELYASIVKELKKLKKRGGSKNLKKTKRRPHNKKRKSVKKRTN